MLNNLILLTRARGARPATALAGTRLGAVAGVALLLAACGGPGALISEDEVARGARDDLEPGVLGPAVESDKPEAVDDPKAVWRERRKILRGIGEWSVFGKLALRTGDAGWTATLYWKQEGDSYRIRLSGPFGGGGVQIEGDGDRVELRTADNQVFTSSDPEQLLYDHVGWWVPLSGLRYWMLGRIEPGVPVDRVYIDVAGRALQFLQDGWEVRYLDYRDVDGFAMPRKATLESDRVTASVLVSRWELER